MTPWLLLLLPGAFALLWVLHRLHRRNVTRWLPACLAGDWPGRQERRSARGQTVHVMFCVADHFEPGVHHATPETERRRVEHWVRQYPARFSSFRDADGLPPRHTFFYPAEQYRPEYLERLGELVQTGYGEVEIHLHHDGDTSENLRRTLGDFARQLRAHGHLGSDRAGRVRFGFVHGNWCLDNSRPDGRWCGVNDELTVLADCGCYADFTLPSAPSPTQTRRINSIYYATDDPQRPRSHDDGVCVRVGGAPTGHLMIVQGPLAIHWTGGKFGLMPRLENASLDGTRTAPARRLDAWVRARVCVAGRPDWLFIKVHTHGCLERNWPALFDAPMAALRRRLHERYNDRVRYALHYVTAREMYNVIKAAERGLTGNPGEYRDFEVLPPPRAVVAVR